MILIDALYINNGGGKVLLDYLICELEKTDSLIFYLLDARIRNKHQVIKSENQVCYLEASIIKRYFFYKRKYNAFSKIFCFGNLPPNIKVEAKVFTYFHNPMYLDVPREFTFIDKFKFQMKIFILRRFKKNTSFWIVQSNLMQAKLQEKFNLTQEKVKILPFYQQFQSREDLIVRQRHTYIYVSNGTPHKNHEKLIDAFCQFYDYSNKGTLILTLSDEYSDLITLIKEKIQQGYPIENIGYVDRETLQKQYMKSEFHIFPSLTESFGLGLIEAIECGCKIIGSDLPYTFEVCDPSIVFDPMSTTSIFEALRKSTDDRVKDTVPKISNNINQLINILN